MHRNLGISRGLIVAEAVMMALAPITGRQAAHDLVYAGCCQATESGKSLYEVLVTMPEIVGSLDQERLRSLTDPTKYLGSAGPLVDRVLGAGRGSPHFSA